MRLILFFVALTIMLMPHPAQAYVGPGLGIGTIGAILGVLLSVLMAILAVFWYPFKRLIAKFRKKSPGPAAGGTPAQAERSASDTDDGD